MKLRWDISPRPTLESALLSHRTTNSITTFISSTFTISRTFTIICTFIVSVVLLLV